jgi:hypothetical protein
VEQVCVATPGPRGASDPTAMQYWTLNRSILVLIKNQSSEQLEVKDLNKFLTFIYIVACGFLITRIILVKMHRLR